MNLAGSKVVVRLVAAHARAHPARVLFTALSTTMAAVVVVWVVSGYDSLVDKFDDFAEGYLGRYQLVVVPASPTTQFGGLGPSASRNGLSPEIVDQLAGDSDVVAVDPILQTRARIEKMRVPGEKLERGGPGGRRAAGAGPAGRATGEPADVATDRAASGTGRAGGRGARSDPSTEDGANPAPPDPAQMMARFARQPALVGTDATEPPHKLLEGRWIDSAHPERLEGVITRSSAELLEVKLGDDLNVAGTGAMGMGSAGAGAGDELHVKIVGIAEQPKTLPPPKFMIGLPPSRDPALRRGPASSALYVSKALCERIAGDRPSPTYVGVVLKSGANVRSFQQRWASALAAAQPAVELQSLADVESEIDNSTTTEVVRTQALSATGIALLAALFIIYTTLSMGVHERIRQFAVLRAVALSKAHITAIIATESLALGLIGWGGGLLAGWGLLMVMRKIRPEVIAENASLGTWCIVLSGLCALGGSLAAAITPAWQATRVTPLDAMAPRRGISTGRVSGWAAVLGVALICLNPLLVFYVPMADTARYAWSAAIGCTSMAMGFLLLAPLAVVTCEKLLGPLVATCLRIPPLLLATQLTTNLWRSVGTSVALTLGLGLFVAMQTWGYSMLGPFTPGTWVPDMLVIMNPMGVPDGEIDAVRHVPGVVPSQCAPLAVKQVKFADDVTGFETRASATRQDSCVLVGVDPKKALAGNKPLFPFEFVAGNRAEAVAKLCRGRFCLVPDHFAREGGLGVGDKFAVLVPPPNATADSQSGGAPTPEAESPPERIEYEIAGVVSMPGWHWMSKQGFRQGRAAGLMFADFGQVRRDFALVRTTLFWMNLDQTASEDQIKASMQAIADRNFDPQSPLARQRRGRRGPAEGGGRTAGASVTLRSADSVRQQINQRADGIIWALSQLPLVTLAVTSLGVVNTVLASIRARRWDLGVLRALGVTRFSLFRLIIAEALLVGVVACVLSLGFGTMAGYCGTGVTRYINIRGGMITPLIIPWAKLAIGFGATLGLCLLAAVWPAASVGRTEPLRLLQAGRATM
ncbi:MAG TPA: FtsX-like permease family protein [Pirellulales bacterium]|jgi:putative ABC transport system permease protein|nr:FtsX-like permease family protein [Pirellulales bacterium]